MYHSCLPSPVTILLFLSHPPHVEVCLYNFWPQDVVFLVGSCGLSLSGRIKSESFWPQFYRWKVNNMQLQLRILTTCWLTTWKWQCMIYYCPTSLQSMSQWEKSSLCCMQKIYVYKNISLFSLMIVVQFSILLAYFFQFTSRCALTEEVGFLETALNYHLSWWQMPVKGWAASDNFIKQWSNSCFNFWIIFWVDHPLKENSLLFAC